MFVKQAKRCPHILLGDGDDIVAATCKPCSTLTYAWLLATRVAFIHDGQVHIYGNDCCYGGNCHGPSCLIMVAAMFKMGFSTMGPCKARLMGALG